MKTPEEIAKKIVDKWVFAVEDSQTTYGEAKQLAELITAAIQAERDARYSEEAFKQWWDDRAEAIEPDDVLAWLRDNTRAPVMPTREEFLKQFFVGTMPDFYKHTEANGKVYMASITRGGKSTEHQITLLGKAYDWLKERMK
jgi:hypothetical protein